MTVVAAAVLVWLVALTVSDVRWQRLPNVLTVPGALAVVMIAAVAGRGWSALAGGLALAAMYLAVHLVQPSSLGAGDVKLALGVGALTGWFGVDVWLLAGLAAPVLTAIVGVSAWQMCGKRTVPHGPAMCVASAAAVGLAVL